MRPSRYDTREYRPIKRAARRVPATLAEHAVGLHRGPTEIIDFYRFSRSWFLRAFEFTLRPFGSMLTAAFARPAKEAGRLLQ